MMRALDLFCGAGGATRGLQMAGFDHVLGIDNKEQPRYCGDRFSKEDALAFLTVNLEDIPKWFSFIWASPPCQAHTSLRSMHNAKSHADLIATTREKLKLTGLPYVIENVVGAPLRDPFMLCGTMFGLGTECGAELHRHRIFETSFPVDVPTCRHSGAPVIGIYGGHYRNRKRKGGLNREAKDFTAADGRYAMEIDWMTGAELSQAIPPAYSYAIACEFLKGRPSRG